MHPESDDTNYQAHNSNQVGDVCNLIVRNKPWILDAGIYSGPLYHLISVVPLDATSRSVSSFSAKNTRFGSSTLQEE